MLLVPETSEDHADNSSDAGLLHATVDWRWQPEVFVDLLDRGADVNARAGRTDEPLIYTATRRRRLDAIEILLDRGASVDAKTRGGDTAWRHAVRRPFPELAARLAEAGACTELTTVDQVAIALLHRDIERARAIHRAQPAAIPQMNDEEARLLGDLAGQGKCEEVCTLLDFGADIEARGLDGGTPLAQCAWFAQPEIARELLARGADVHANNCDHGSTPLGWVAHGSRASGGATEHQNEYVELLDLMLDAGASIALPGDPPESPGRRLWHDASDALRARLLERGFDGLPPP